MISDYNDAGLDLSHDPEFYALMAESFERCVGRCLAPDGEGAEWLYEQSPAVVLAHNTEADPRFIYANRAAQACFEYSWDEFITLPSRLSAEAPDRVSFGPMQFDLVEEPIWHENGLVKAPPRAGPGAEPRMDVVEKYRLKG